MTLWPKTGVIGAAVFSAVLNSHQHAEKVASDVFSVIEAVAEDEVGSVFGILAVGDGVSRELSGKGIELHGVERSLKEGMEVLEFFVGIPEMVRVREKVLQLSALEPEEAAQVSFLIEQGSSEKLRGALEELIGVFLATVRKEFLRERRMSETLSFSSLTTWNM